MKCLCHRARNEAAYKGIEINLCSIVNAKSGLCKEGLLILLPVCKLLDRH